MDIGPWMLMGTGNGRFHCLECGFCFYSTSCPCYHGCSSVAHQHGQHVWALIQRNMKTEDGCRACRGRMEADLRCSFFWANKASKHGPCPFFVQDRICPQQPVELGLSASHPRQPTKSQDPGRRPASHPCREKACIRFQREDGETAPFEIALPPLHAPPPRPRPPGDAGTFWPNTASAIPGPTPAAIEIRETQLATARASVAG